MDSGRARRIGMFFILIGIVGCVLFISLIRAGKPVFEFLLISLLAFAFGYLFLRRESPPPADERFHTLRKIRRKPDKKGPAKK